MAFSFLVGLNHLNLAFMPYDSPSILPALTFVLTFMAFSFLAGLNFYLAFMPYDPQVGSIVLTIVIRRALRKGDNRNEHESARCNEV